MISHACAVAVALIIQSAPGVDGGLQTEFRITRQHGVEGAASEWSVLPWGAAHFAWPGTRAELRYSPRVAVRYQPSQPSSPVGAQLLHAVSGEVRSRSWRALESWARMGLERGRVAIGPLQWPESISGGGATTVPSATEVEYLNASASLGLSARVDRRTSWSSAIGYRFSGDLRDRAGATSPAPLPLQHRPEWTTSVDYALTRRDALLARASASGVFVNEGWILQADAMGGWRRAWSRRLSIEGGLGLGAQSREDPQRLVPVPVGKVAMSYDGLLGSPVAARFEVRAAPFVDPFTGSAYPRTDASLGASWSVTPALRLHSLAAVGAPLGRDARRYDAIGYADCGATLVLPRGVSLAAGARWAVRRLILGADRPRVDWGAFVGFSYHYQQRSDT